MSVSRWCTMWMFDGYYKKSGTYAITIYEPLRTTAPPDARAVVQWGKYVDFWKRNRTKDEQFYYDEHVSFIDLIDVAPVMIFVDGSWYERGGGRVEWFDDWNCWVMTWIAFRNSRMAHMMNSGMPVYKSGDPEITDQIKAIVSDQNIEFHVGNQLGNKVKTEKIYLTLLENMKWVRDTILRKLEKKY